MNKKILSFAVAAAMAAPLVSYADVKVSGIIQAEIASLEVADGNENLTGSLRDGSFNDMDRQTLTNDFLGTILNEGPNHIKFDIDEKLGNGLKAQARYVAAFNSSGNFGSGIIGEEAWVGLSGSHLHMRYGTLEGAYKSSQAILDPWAWTSLQSRGTGGGMSGEYFNRISGNTININNFEPQNGLTNDGFIEGALELGFKYSGFSFTLQGIVDDASGLDGAGLLELRYVAPSDAFTIWLAGSFEDLDDATDLDTIKDNFDDAVDSVSDKFDDLVGEDIIDSSYEATEDNDEASGNWKLGASFKIGSMMTLGLQYEDAEIGTLDGDRNSDGGEYIMGSLKIKPMENITIAAWVAGYLSDIDNGLKMVDSEGNKVDEDALSWSVGGMYNFSNRTMIYAGYRQTDSDNDFRDENIATLGIRHSF
ncbi:MAG: porin [Thiomargarita sp.]|nr:porin [Thiomargarita sp.]